MTDNKDLNQRFDQLEKRLDTLAVGNPLSTFQDPNSRSDEIDLRELFGILWQGKWWIIGITFLFAVAGVAYALSLPNMYESEGIYASVQNEGGGGGGGQLGGLAAIAGVSLGAGESDDIDQAMELVVSWPFLERVIDKHNLKPLIMAVKGWDREADELIWDGEIYDPIREEWLRQPAKDIEAEPSSYETYVAFRSLFSASFDEKAGMLNVVAEHYSPQVAKRLVDILIVEINYTFRSRDIMESKRSIDYLEGRILETSIAGMQSVFYGMIETHIKKLMLAELDEEYLLKTIVETRVAEIKSGPKRAVIALFCLMLGFLGVVITLLLRRLLLVSTE